MAQRPIFIPDSSANGLVQECSVSFAWHAGFALSQMQKSVKSLHENAAIQGFSPVLEISSKSTKALGVQLSAFNLYLNYNEIHFTVESAYQGSKVFEKGGPFTDIYNLPSRDAKQDDRLKGHGDLKYFDFFGTRWELQPVTAFYDWLYIQALLQNPQLSKYLLDYRAFSDIAFNPSKSFSCQARSAAIYVTLEQMNEIERVQQTPSEFKEIYSLNEMRTKKPDDYTQRLLF